MKALDGFMNFVREQGVVGLAVGLAIGAQTTETVGALVDGFISPIVAFILGGADLTELTWTLVKADEVGGRELIIGYGGILQSLIALLAVAGVIYYIVKQLKLDQMDKKAK